jgi:hypothetical protein
MLLPSSGINYPQLPTGGKFTRLRLGVRPSILQAGDYFKTFSYQRWVLLDIGGDQGLVDG